MSWQKITCFICSVSHSSACLLSVGTVRPWAKTIESYKLILHSSEVCRNLAVQSCVIRLTNRLFSWYLKLLRVIVYIVVWGEGMRIILLREQTVISPAVAKFWSEKWVSQAWVKVSDRIWLILQRDMCGVLYAYLWRGLTLYSRLWWILLCNLGCSGTVASSWFDLLGDGVTTKDGTLPSWLTSDHTFCFPRKTRKGRLSLRFKIPYENEEVSSLCWGH